MKTIRSLMILAGLPLLVLALGVTGAKAQGGSGTEFAGTFTLPSSAQWGNMALPAGDYTLSYAEAHGAQFVKVRGTAKGSPQGVILVAGIAGSSATKSALVCVREGRTLIVRALEMPVIGESVNFAMPHGEKLVARNRDHKGYTQLAEAPMLIERISITRNAK